MKKKIVILSAVFLVVFALSVWLNSQIGFYYNDAFWRKAGDGDFVALNGDRVKYVADGKNVDFTLTLDGKNITAHAKNEGDNVETAFSDGCTAVIYGYGGSDGWYFDDRDEIVINDIDKMGLRFSAPTGKERREVFYGGDGDTVAGETVMLETVSGEDIYLGARWFDNEDNAQENGYIIYDPTGYSIASSTDDMKTVTLKNGSSVKRSGYDAVDELFENERESATLYQNEQGEYLIDTDELFCINVGGAKHERTWFARFLIETTEMQTGWRGQPFIIFLYVVLYVMGALTFLFPQKTAFMFGKWRFKNEPELSEAGVEVEMFSGIVIMASGILLAFVPVLIR